MRHENDLNKTMAGQQMTHFVRCEFDRTAIWCLIPCFFNSVTLASITSQPPPYSYNWIKDPGTLLQREAIPRKILYLWNCPKQNFLVLPKIWYGLCLSNQFEHIDTLLCNATLNIYAFAFCNMQCLALNPATCNISVAALLWWQKALHFLVTSPLGFFFWVTCQLGFSL